MLFPVAVWLSLLVTTISTAPVDERAGVTAVTEAAPAVLTLVAAVPPTVTPETALKLVPVMVMVVPPALDPVFGLTLTTVGAGRPLEELLEELELEELLEELLLEELELEELLEELLLEELELEELLEELLLEELELEELLEELLLEELELEELLLEELVPGVPSPPLPTPSLILPATPEFTCDLAGSDNVVIKRSNTPFTPALEFKVLFFILFTKSSISAFIAAAVGE